MAQGRTGLYGGVQNAMLQYEDSLAKAEKALSHPVLS